MRMLHVTHSFAAGEAEAAFLEMLRQFRAEDPSIEHHVLAFHGGPLEAAYRDAAHEVTIGGDQHTIERQLATPYDVVYILCERCAYRVLPELLAWSSMPVVYGKSDDSDAVNRRDHKRPWRAEEAMLAACDAATFTTARLALHYDLSAGHTTILGRPSDLAPSSRGDADPVQPIARRLLQALQGACAAGPYWRAVDNLEAPGA